MKYITQVMQDKDVKHIVEVEGKNVEVIQQSAVIPYGNKKGEARFLANGIYVSKDLKFNHGINTSDFIHFAQVMLAIELVRFVINHLEVNRS